MGANGREDESLKLLCKVLKATPRGERYSELSKLPVATQAALESHLRLRRQGENRLGAQLESGQRQAALSSSDDKDGQCKATPRQQRPTSAPAGSANAQRKLQQRRAYPERHLRSNVTLGQTAGWHPGNASTYTVDYPPCE